MNVTPLNELFLYKYNLNFRKFKYVGGFGVRISRPSYDALLKIPPKQKIPNKALLSRYHTI